MYNIFDNIMPPNCLHPRMDQVYVTWYINWARLLVLGLVPFSAISFLNTKIYVAIRSVSHTHVRRVTRVTCQTAAEGAAAQGGPHVRGADADRGRVHGLQPAQAAAQHARDHRHTTSQQVDKILL